MHYKSKKVFLSIAAVLVILGLIIPKLKSLNNKKNSNSSFRNSAITVAVYVVKGEKLKDRILTTGTILANEEVEHKSEIPGRIMEIHFKEGKRVKQGQLLVKINDAELQAQLLKAEYRKKN